MRHARVKCDQQIANLPVADIPKRADGRWTPRVEHIAGAIAFSIPVNAYVTEYRKLVQHRPGVALTRKTAAGWIPLKPAATYLLDALGSPAWDIMHRRTQVMFDSPNPFFNNQEAKGYEPPSGALTGLLDSLQALIKHDKGTKYELTIIGHSMGAIVASEIARTRDSLSIDNLVFMAPANSLREYQVGVLPYMQRHPETKLYVLTLHPLADTRESHFFRLAPYGSLLEYIDGYFSHPETDLDRMMGKYNNVMAASYLVPDALRSRIHIKAFGYRDGSGCGDDKEPPYQHGQFNDPGVPFWRESFWHPGTPGCEVIKKTAPTKMH